MNAYPNVEKPNHLHYLREFRVEACTQFKQHQCQQHRPYTCFNWHFANQRRRRPVRRADGTFNYSADIYCDKYDENTGICPDGDSCAYLHRVAGDVERKYHLRYYKTALCVHPTDARGVCTKSGAHCAFAHSALDLRQPLHDVQEAHNGILDPENRDRTSFVVEDPQWHDQVHVLSCYKTEQCRKPARLCRQGYACPFYHNSKDRRRPPAVFKYRSTPCPAAKSVDEWLEPEQCENGDDCGYCHTRTEQQFHPEIYKSTKCNDMLEHGYCPRAVFCAFAHHDSELHLQRVPYHQQHSTATMPAPIPYRKSSTIDSSTSPRSRAESFCTTQSPVLSSFGTTPSYSAVLKNRQPLSRSMNSQSGEDSLSNSYPRAPGFERVQISPQRLSESAIGRLRTSSLNMGQLDLGFSVSSDSVVSSLPTYSALSSMCRGPVESSMHALPSAIDELSMDDLSSSALSPIVERKEHKLLTDIFSNTPISSSSSPMQIPESVSPFGSSPLTSTGECALMHRKSVTESPQPTFAHKPLPAFMSIYQEVPKSELVLTPPETMSRDELLLELTKKRDELLAHHDKLAAWEDGLKQARQACEAWKKDAEYHRRMSQQAESDKARACFERDQALMQLDIVKRELRMTATNGRSHSPFELPHFSSIGPFGTFVRAEGDQQNGGPVCARCGREKRADSRNTSCRLCCS